MGIVRGFYLAKSDQPPGFFIKPMEPAGTFPEMVGWILDHMGHRIFSVCAVFDLRTGHRRCYVATMSRLNWNEKDTLRSWAPASGYEISFASVKHAP